MSYVIVLGLIAGTLTSLAFFPQVVKAWKSKSTKDVSLGTLALMCTGVFLWVIYGIYISSLPLIATNVVTFVFAFVVLVLKTKYK